MAEIPDWQPFEGGTGSHSPVGPDAGQVVAVVASGGALTAGWAPETVLRLAGSWSAEGRRVMLVDAAVSGPTLHTAAEMENLEGLTDAALFGVSVGRVAKPVTGESFFLITAGSPTADPSALVTHDRWQQLVSGFVEAGVTLVLFLHGGDEHTRAFLGSAGDVIVLAEPGEDAAAVLGDHAGRVRSVIGPATMEAQGVTGGSPDAGKTQHLDFTAVAGEEAVAAEVERSSLRPPAASDSWRSGGRRNLLIVIVILVVVAVVVAYAIGMLGGPANAGGA